MRGFIVYSDYDIINDETIVRLFGRLENGHSFVSISKFEPYFYIKESDFKKVEKYLLKYKTEKTEFTNFKGEKVIKIIAKNHRELNKLFQATHHLIEKYEADIKPNMRFLIDHNIFSALDIEGDYQTSGEQKVDRIYNNPKISPIPEKEEFKPKLKLLSIDIESDKHSDKLFCIGLYAENYKKCFFVTDKKLENAVSCKTESEALEKFKSEFLKFDPDIVTGWNIIDFDFVYLQKLFKKHKIQFDLGRTNDNIRLRIEENYLKSSSADIPGRQVLDGLNMISDPFLQQAPSMRNAQFESYSLEDVSQEILGKGKLIAGESRHEEIEKLYRKNTLSSLQEIVNYNLNDCKLVFEILEKTKTIELAIDRSQLTGMPLDKITSSIAAFDSLFIREAKKHHLVSPTTHYQTKEERIKGGYVFSAGAGIFNNVLVFDFKSLYPSILCTFNISPDAHLEKEQARKEKDAIETLNHEYFRNNKGILPEIIFKLHNAREKAKKEKNELASYAIKTTMNSFWGVLASPNCRYFNLDMANAITSFARWVIQTTAQLIEKKGYKVIYEDTDSVFVETGLEKENANLLGKEIANYINNYYKDYVKQKFNRQSYLELQFDKQFISLMIPQLRAKAKEGEEAQVKAAKKRYAGLLVDENGNKKMDLTGLEFVRRDWTAASKKFQLELLSRIFEKKEVGEYVKDFVRRLRAGEFDELLVYRKALRKSTDEYIKTTPPHVKAAR
ncbi:MAG: DNA polymerase II, partial [Candidatus Pacearchaeota archaeon]